MYISDPSQEPGKQVGCRAFEQFVIFSFLQNVLVEVTKKPSYVWDSSNGIFKTKLVKVEIGLFFLVSLHSVRGVSFSVSFYTPNRQDFISFFLMLLFLLSLCPPRNPPGNLCRLYLRSKYKEDGHCKTYGKVADMGVSCTCFEVLLWQPRCLWTLVVINAVEITVHSHQESTV